MATEHQKVQDQLERYKYARDNGHLDFLEKAKKCENFFAGRQWDDATKARLTRLRRPALTLNKTLPAVAAAMAEQINNRVDIAHRATASGNPETAAALDKLYLQIVNENGYDDIESYMFDDGIITGRGFVDIRMDFSRNIFGDIRIKLENPFNVMLDPDAEEYHPRSWKEIFTTKWLSLDDIGNLYGKEAKAKLKDRIKSTSGFSYDMIDYRHGSFGGEWRRTDDSDDENMKHRRRFRLVERQSKIIRQREHFVDLTTGDTRPIPESWDHNRISHVMNMMGNIGTVRMPTESIRWTSTVDDELVHDADSPYRSFTMRPYFPFFRRGDTIGLVENMLDPQEFYNKAMSQQLHIVNTTANSGYKVKRGSLVNMTIEELEQRGAETGLVVELDDINDLDKIKPNAVPTGLDRVGQLVENDLKETSMISDSQRGFDRADVAAKAILAKKQSGSANFAKPLENLLITRRMVAEKILEVVQDFYTEERTYRVTGGGLMPTEEEITINQKTPEGEILNDVTSGEYTIIATAVPARNEFEDSQFEEAMRLRELGVSIPDHVLVEHSHLNRKQELAEEIKQRTGYGEPTEMEQEAAALENQIKKLEAQMKEVDIRKRESEIVLNMVRAQRDADEENGGENEAELNRMQDEQAQKLAELKLRKYEIDENLKLKREELQQTMALKEKEFRAKQQEAKMQRRESKPMKEKSAE